jgi:Outer membrane protein beta-barrel domain
MMRQALVILIVIGMTFLGGKPTQAQIDQNLRAWFVGGEIGEGQLSLSSDQIHRDRTPTFALGFFGGHRLGDQARVGLEVNGWLLQASNLNDPTVGEGVSNVLGVIDVFPTRKIPLFLRGGGGLAMYQNNRPAESGGTGWSWTGGAGYEFRLGERLGLAPIVEYAYGRFDDVRNPITVETGRHYSVVEFKIAAIWHFGKRKRE